MLKSKTCFGFLLLAFLVPLIVLTPPALAADTNETVDLQRSYLQLQAALQENRQITEAVAASNAAVLDQRLRAMESALADERSVQLSSVEHSNSVILISAGTIAAFAILALLTAILQWKSVDRLVTAASRIGAVHAPTASAEGEALAMQHANVRFMSLVERLENRIHELEAAVKSPRALSENGFENGASNGSSNGNGLIMELSAPSATDKAGVVNVLFNKSQTLLKLEKAEDALQCLDELLSLDPGNAQAFLKKGVALERLKRFDEALQCYDRAIEEDNSMTMAYLGKGSVFNRLERYAEALACYERALKKPEKAA